MTDQSQNDSFQTIGSLMPHVLPLVKIEDSTSTQSEKPSLITGSHAATLAQTGMRHSETGCAPRNTRALPSKISRDNPAQTAQRATSAASWLQSSAVAALTTRSSYSLRFNEKTGLDEFVPVSVSVDFAPEKISREAAERMADLMDLAAHEEIVAQLTRLAVHRPKGSLGEIALPVFIEDVALDLKLIGATSLGIALTCHHLRRKPDDKWFPAWPEIERVAASFETAITRMRQILAGEDVEKIEFTEQKPRPVVPEPSTPEQVEQQEAAWQRGLDRLSSLGLTLASVPRVVGVNEFCDAVEKH